MSEAEGWVPGMAPTAEQVVAARQAAGLTQAQAAGAVHYGSHVRWAEVERGVRNMDAARFELFLLLHNLHPRLRVQPLKG